MKSKKNYIWVLEIKENDQWRPTMHSALSRREMMHIKNNFLYGRPNEVVRARKYEAKA